MVVGPLLGNLSRRPPVPGRSPGGACEHGELFRDTDFPDWMQMDYRTLPGTGLRVSALSMGCGRLGSWWQGRTDTESRRAIALALDLGINVFDTSDVYGRGRSERLLGQALKPVRIEVVIVTKCGLLKTPSGLKRALRSADRGRRGTSDSILGILRERRFYSPEYVLASAEASLRRLQTDRIDILLLHSPPEEILRGADFLDAFDHLKRRGAVRSCGISARDIRTARLALDLPGIDCLQIDLSVCRTAAADLVGEAHGRGIGLLARRPFESGDGLQALSPEERMRTVGVCLRYVLDTPGVASVVTGMTRPRHVSDNVAALASSASPGGRELDEVRRSICLR